MTTNQQYKIELEKAFEEAGYDVEALFYDTYYNYSLVVVEIWHSLEPNFLPTPINLDELVKVVGSVFPYADKYMQADAIGKMGTYMFMF